MITQCYLGSFSGYYVDKQFILISTFTQVSDGTIGRIAAVHCLDKYLEYAPQYEANATPKTLVDRNYYLSVD